jgi:hypothetical protein
LHKCHTDEVRRNATALQSDGEPVTAIDIAGKESVFAAHSAKKEANPSLSFLFELHCLTSRGTALAEALSNPMIGMLL